LTSNGKIDRNRLPKPKAGSRLAYVPPQGETEEKLAHIWKELLAREQVGREDQFFECGGHSLKAMVLVARVHKQLGVKLTWRDVFRFPRLKELAQCIQQAKKATFHAIEPAPVQATYPASSAQKRIYTSQQLSPSSTTYNVPTVLEIK